MSFPFYSCLMPRNGIHQFVVGMLASEIWRYSGRLSWSELGLLSRWFLRYHALRVVIDRKRFWPSIRPKIIGRIFGRNEYSASAAENEKSFVYLLFISKQYFPEKVNF
jgi:hypothetical protein